MNIYCTYIFFKGGITENPIKRDTAYNWLWIWQAFRSHSFILTILASFNFSQLFFAVFFFANLIGILVIFPLIYFLFGRLRCSITLLIHHPAIGQSMAWKHIQIKMIIARWNDYIFGLSCAVLSSLLSCHFIHCKS